MSSSMPIKFRNEEAVKKALRIDSFRNITKDKIMEFASLIPYVDKEVAIAIINQFPAFSEFGKTVISCYMERCDKLLESNNESQKAVVRGYQTILEALAKRMDNQSISEEERSYITKDMMDVADKIAAADLRNKKFLEKTGNKILLGIGLVFAGVAAALGINSRFNGNGDLPQVSEKEDENTI